MKKTRTVSYFDPDLGKQVEKTIKIPPAAKVTNLASGATVEEIESLEDLHARWGMAITTDLATPLAQHGRAVLRNLLLEAITDEDERSAITTMANSFHFEDDRVLKLIGRLVGEVKQQHKKRGNTVSRAVQLKHEKALLQQTKSRLQTENKTLHSDVAKLVEECAALRRKKGGSDLIDEVARLSINKQDLANEKAKVTAALTAQVKITNEVTQERDALLRDAQRNLELALTDYETEVMGKLGNVAEDHNKLAVETAALKAEVTKLAGEKNLLRSQVEHEKQVNRNHSTNLTNIIAKVKRESDMSNEQPTNDTEAEAPLKAGDEVFCKVSGEGPFVLLTQVEEAQIEYANPISNKRNSFSVGKLPIHNAWLVRCKDATMRTLPAPVLTKDRPKSSFSFNGVKRLITSDVTSKLLQAAIWVSMLTLLYMRG